MDRLDASAGETGTVNFQVAVKDPEVKSRNPVTPSRSPHLHRVYQQMTAGRVGNTRDLIADIRRSGDATVRFVYNGGQDWLLELRTVF